MNKSIKLRMPNIFVSFTRTVGVGVGEGHSPTTLAWVDFLGAPDDLDKNRPFYICLLSDLAFN